MKSFVEPVERGTDVLYLADAIVVLSLAQAGSAEIEAQHRKAKAVEGFHGVEDDFVVEGSAVEGMRVADQCGVRCVRSTRVEQSFELPGRPLESESGDGGIRGEHGIRLHRRGDW